jgi:transposase-like protein
MKKCPKCKSEHVEKIYDVSSGIVFYECIDCGKQFDFGG